VAHPKHGQVRQRYGACCGYCGVSEVTTGGDLTIDHFHPATAGGDDGDDNLVYCCFKCNQYKADFHPNPEDLLRGRRLLHPLRDNVALHIRENHLTGQLEPLSDTGQFHIALLRLNRPALVAYRRQQRFTLLMFDRLGLVEAEMAQLKAVISAQATYISDLEQRLGVPPSEPR
jgi:hypothetical protein